MKTSINRIIAIALLATTSAFANADSIKPEFVDMLLSPYFKLQASLASDDLSGAKANANTFLTMLDHGPSHKDAPSLMAFGSEARKIVDSSDLKAARNAFHTISKELGKLVDSVGTSGKSDVIKMRCPMAFGGQGGEWLQSSEDLANPYYGSMMYRCGGVVEQLASASAGH